MMPHDPNFAWTVGELNRYAQNVVKTHLGDTIWLCGELGRIQLNASGHVYGVLKDELGNSISFAFFGGARKVAPLRLTAGDCVLLWGNLDLYVTAGTYQFVARDLRPSNTQGGLMQRYLETRKRLDAEGLFARERASGTLETLLTAPVTTASEFTTGVGTKLANGATGILSRSSSQARLWESSAWAVSESRLPK